MPDRQAKAKGRTFFMTFAMLAISASACGAQFGLLGGKTAGAQVLVIGSYHMSNPGLDAVNVTADDVLAPKRQREIEQLAERIAAFRPTKVAVEIPYGRDSASNGFYRRYVQGTYALDHTEMQQVGFRVAKAVGLPRVYGVDYDLDVNVASVMVWAISHGQTELPMAVQALSARLLADVDSLIKHATVGEIIATLNSARADSAQRIYLAALRVGADTSYVGANMTARWYERNLKIASNVLRLIESPADRVLVIIGAAHGPILREILSGVPGVRVVPPEDALRGTLSR